MRFQVPRLQHATQTISCPRMGHSSDDKCYQVLVVDRCTLCRLLVKTGVSEEGGRMEPYVICIRRKEGANLRQAAS